MIEDQRGDGNGIVTRTLNPDNFKNTGQAKIAQKPEYWI
jgi:hypothetical protein